MIPTCRPSVSVDAMSEARDQDEEMRIGEPETAAVGVPGVAVSMRYALSEMGPARSLRTLLRSTSRTASTARAAPGRSRRRAAPPSSARTAPRRWPRRRPAAGTPQFFAEHPVAELAARSDYWLGPAGPADRADVAGDRRHPLRADRLGRRLQAHRRRAARARHPNRAVFYTAAGPATRPRSPTSCWSAVRHQQPARLLQHVPRVRGAALTETIGIGKGRVTLEDISTTPT